MRVIQLSNNVIQFATLDWELKVFDVIMETKFGTSYNSYLVKGTEKTALFDSTKLPFWEEYEKELKEHVELSKIDYLVISHTEPDHSGSIEKILELNPDITIVGTKVALGFLKQIVNRDFKELAVVSGDTLELGNMTLQFEVLPNLHWPDTMFTYIKEEKMLVTCDSFGAHYCSEEAYLSQIKDKENYYEARKYYYDCIISPFKDFMLKGIDFAKSLELSYIATGHGPIIDEGFEELFDSYTKWSTKKIREGVIIAYVSAYGYTEQLAKEIEKGIRSKNIEVKSYDLQNVDIAEVAEEVRDVKGLLIGSSTILSDAIAPAYELTINMHPVTHHGILASAFGSYGWSGEAVGNLIDRMKQLRMKTMDGFKIRFKPSEEELQQAYEFGVRFGEELEK